MASSLARVVKLALARHGPWRLGFDSTVTAVDLERGREVAAGPLRPRAVGGGDGGGWDAAPARVDRLVGGPVVEIGIPWLRRGAGGACARVSPLPLLGAGSVATPDPGGGAARALTRRRV